MSYPSYQKILFTLSPSSPLQRETMCLIEVPFIKALKVSSTYKGLIMYTTLSKVTMDTEHRKKSSITVIKERKSRNFKMKMIEMLIDIKATSKQRLTEINSQNYLNYIMNQKKNAHSRYLSQSQQLPTAPINDSYPQQKTSPISSLYNRSRLNEITNPDIY